MADKPRCRFRYSLRTVFVLLTLLGVVCAPSAWLAREYQWSRTRHEFNSQHSIAYVHRTYSRPLGCNRADFVILNSDSPPSEADRARKLFPEVRYVGQFTSEATYLDVVRGSYDKAKIVWFGAAPDWARRK